MQLALGGERGGAGSGVLWGVTWFRERSGAADSHRWIQIGGAFEKRLDGAGSGAQPIGACQVATSACDPGCGETPVSGHLGRVVELPSLVPSTVLHSVLVDERLDGGSAVTAGFRALAACLPEKKKLETLLVGPAALSLSRR